MQQPHGGAGRGEDGGEGESWEEFVRRRTKEFNERTREKPLDESLWLEFAAFQASHVNEEEDQVVARQLGSHRRALAQATTKPPASDTKRKQNGP